MINKKKTLSIRFSHRVRVPDCGFSTALLFCGFVRDYILISLPTNFIFDSFYSFLHLIRIAISPASMTTSLQSSSPSLTEVYSQFLFSDSIFNKQYPNDIKSKPPSNSDRIPISATIPTSSSFSSSSTTSRHDTTSQLERTELNSVNVSSDSITNSPSEQHRIKMPSFGIKGSLTTDPSESMQKPLAAVCLSPGSHSPNWNALVETVSHSMSRFHLSSPSIPSVSKQTSKQINNISNGKSLSISNSQFFSTLPNEPKSHAMTSPSVASGTMEHLPIISSNQNVGENLLPLSSNSPLSQSQIPCVPLSQSQIPYVLLSLPSYSEIPHYMSGVSIKDISHHSCRSSDLYEQRHNKQSENSSSFQLQSFSTPCKSPHDFLSSLRIPKDPFELPSSRSRYYDIPSNKYGNENLNGNFHSGMKNQSIISPVDSHVLPHLLLAEPSLERHNSIRLLSPTKQQPFRSNGSRDSASILTQPFPDTSRPIQKESQSDLDSCVSTQLNCLVYPSVVDSFFVQPQRRTSRLSNIPSHISNRIDVHRTDQNEFPSRLKPPGFLRRQVKPRPNRSFRELDKYSSVTSNQDERFPTKFSPVQYVNNHVFRDCGQKSQSSWNLYEEYYDSLVYNSLQDHQDDLYHVPLFPEKLYNRLILRPFKSDRFINEFSNHSSKHHLRSSCITSTFHSSKSSRLRSSHAAYPKHQKTFSNNYKPQNVSNNHVLLSTHTVDKGRVFIPSGRFYFQH